MSRRGTVRKALARRAGDRGFTLIELLVAITLLGLVTGALTAVFLTAINGTQAGAGDYTHVVHCVAQRVRRSEVSLTRKLWRHSYDGGLVGGNFPRAVGVMNFGFVVEDALGLSNLDEIIKVQGVDVVCVSGYSDLANSMGFVGERDHPEVRKAVLDAGRGISREACPRHETRARHSSEAQD